MSFRSVLYMPASNARAVARARTLACDAVVLDLEDAVAPEAKADARAVALAAIAEGGFGERRLIVRVNGAATEHFAADVAAARRIADPEVAILLPKVSRPDDLRTAAEALPGRRLWAMIETCDGIQDIAAIARASRDVPLDAFVVGANDLAKEMGCRLERSRRPIWGALGAVVIAARANGILAFDAVYNAIDDEAGFRAECEEGADFGFDGKTLIHPRQIDLCNQAFSPSEDEITHARAVVETFARPENQTVNALRVDGRMVERLHLAPALRVLERAGLPAGLSPGERLAGIVGTRRGTGKR